MNAIVHRAGWLIAAALGIFVVVSMAGVVRGGPLDPPASPSPTLPQVEPRMPISALPFPISASGSYFLTKTLHGTAGQAAITIAADDVTIDLNGFALLGDGVAGSAISAGTVTRLTVTNGTIAGWGGMGISAGTATSGRYERLELASNTGGGIEAGAGSMLLSLIVKMNGGNGIAVTSTLPSGISSVRDSVVEGSVLDNIRIANNVYVENNSINNDAVDGVHVLGSGNRVEGNHIVNSGAAGIHADALATGNRIDGNNVVNGGVSAINIEGIGNLIVRNTVRGGPSEIAIGQGNTKGPTDTQGTPLQNPWANVVY